MNQYEEQEETWKPINVCLPDRYEVSNKGKVRNKKTNKLVNPWLNNCGYHAVKLPCGIKKNSDEYTYKQFYVHRLMLMTFDPIKEQDTYTVHHKDGIRTNNVLENLTWMPREEHSKMEFDQGNYKIGKLGKDNLLFKGTIGKFSKEGILLEIYNGFKRSNVGSKKANIYNSVNRLKTANGFHYRRFPKTEIPMIGKKYDIFDSMFHTESYIKLYANNSQLNLSF